MNALYLIAQVLYDVYTIKSAAGISTNRQAVMVGVYIPVERNGSENSRQQQTDPASNRLAVPNYTQLSIQLHP